MGFINCSGSFYFYNDFMFNNDIGEILAYFSAVIKNFYRQLRFYLKTDLFKFEG